MKAILWTSLEYAVNIYQGFIMAWFVYKFLNPKSSGLAKNGLLYFGLLFGLTITLLNQHVIYEGYTSSLYIIVLLVYAFTSFSDRLIKKILATIIPNIILLLITTVELNFISSIKNISIQELITNNNSTRFFTLIIIQISLWISLKIIVKVFRFSDNYTVSDWSPIIIILVSSFVLVSLLHALTLSVNTKQRIYINLSYLVILILNFIMFYVIHSLYQKNKQIAEMKLSALREQHMEQFVDNAHSQYESIRKIKHDLKDQISTVYDLLSDDKIEEAMEFIAKSNEIVNRIESFVQTNNAVANAIINSKLTVASTLGIKVSCITISDFNGINELDLCDLLGNTLENAITACKNMSLDENRFIYLEIGRENNIYSFLVKNSISHSVIENNPRLKTTKTDKHLHGLGTSIIKDIANKYDGRYDYYEIENTFCCSVILKT